MPDLYQRRFMAGANGGAEAVSDDTGRAGVRFQQVLIAERVRIDDALRCEHQQQQDKPQAAAQLEGGQVHRAHL